MNTSTIIDMIAADPAIPKDIAGFVKRMNAQTIKQTVSSHVTVIDKEVMVSLAELNGGPATDRNVQDALAILKQRPLLDEIHNRSELAKAAVMCGDVVDSKGLTDKLAAPIEKS